LYCTPAVTSIAVPDSLLGIDAASPAVAAAAAAASELIRQLILSTGRAQREHSGGFFPGDRRRSALAVATICFLVDFTTRFSLSGRASVPGSTVPPSDLQIRQYADRRIEVARRLYRRTCFITDVIVVVIVDTRSYGIKAFAVVVLLLPVRRS